MGGSTIQKWLKKFGKTHLMNKVIRIEMKDEKDKIKELERQKQALESTIKVLEGESGIKLKKNTDTTSLHAAFETVDFTKDNKRKKIIINLVNFFQDETDLCWKK